MPNPKILSDLLKAAGKLPKGSPAAREAVGAKIAAEEAEKAALYKAQPIATETGRKALAKAKQTLMIPEQQAKMEAELREKGKQKFLEPSVVKQRMYHGTNKDFPAFSLEHQYTGEGATHSGSGFYFTESPESASRYAMMKGIEGANVKPVYLNIKKPLHFDWDKGEVTGANIKLTNSQVKKIIESAPNIRDADYSPLTNWGDIRGKNYEKVLNEAAKAYADSSMLSALRNDFFLDDHGSWLRALNKATGYDSATTVTPTGERHYIAWFPEQVKSATGNIGTYDITTHDITKKDGGLAMATGGQAFPLQEEFQAEVERRAARPRTRAGVPVEDTNVLGGALRGLANTLGGLAFGRTVGTLGMPADILEPTAATGAMIPMFGMAGMPAEISKALVQRFAPKGLDIPAPTSEYLLEKGLEKFKPPQEFEVSAKLGRFLPFDITEMQAAGRKLKALQPTFTEMMQTGLERATEPTRSYVIKPEGGNWVRNAAEKYVEPLRMRMHEKDPVQTIAELETKYGKEAADQMLASGFYPNIREYAAINNFIDKKLTKYIRNEMATPSDPVRLQADQWAETKTKLLADKQKQIDKVQADIQKAQRERNVEPEVLTRSQARLRELQKEKALIKNRKGLHFEPRDVLPPIERRKEAGFPKTFAKTKVGSSWEDISDLAIRADPYMNQPEIGIGKTYAELKGNVPEEYLREINAALDKLGGKFAMENPETLAYRTSLQPNYLGFDHLIDELRGALSNEALPESLRLTTKTLDKMSVPQAIEHVDKINAWRASQKAEADAARAANQATVVHKEYPEAGLKWVELKLVTPEQFDLPEGFKMIEDASRNQAGEIIKMGYRLESPEGKLVSYGETPAEAYAQHFGKKALEDALKYEGEMLKHCVGGYCPDVISGKSRIFSLRDEAGRPHATIEVQPKDMVFSDLVEHLGGNEELANDYLARGFQKRQQGMDDKSPLAHAMEEAKVPRLQKIKQIKGESNRAPSKEVEPYVQDFVKSGQWSHVGDISNAGLMQSKNAPWRQRFEEAGIDVPEYFSEKDYQDLVKQYFEKTSTPMDPKFMYETYGIQMTPEGGAPNMADGGAVHPAVEKFAASLPHPAVTEFAAKLADGGGVWKTMVDGKYNTVPDVNDAERVIQGPAFAEGGGVWKQLVEGAGNA